MGYGNKGNPIIQVDNKELKSEMSRNLNVSPSVISAFWTPPTQPPARADKAGYFADAFSGNADKYINDLWEPLRAQEPQYITRESLGLDTSSTYTVWKYVFEPPTYEKTLIIGANLHGGETTGQLALYRFLYHVVNDWGEYPQLSYIRHKVRLVILPIQNPWGLSQSPRKRQNSNGVDINRNFDYNWSSYATGVVGDHDYKGTAPFSEKETQYIRDVLSQYSNAVAYLDLHNLGTPDSNYVLYTPRNTSNRRNIFKDVINHFKKTGETVKWGENTFPSSYQYAAAQHGMDSSNPEFADGIWSTQYDSVEMTKAVEWFSNIIIQHAKEYKKATHATSLEPFVVRGLYTHTGAGSITFPTTYGLLNDLEFSFDAPTSGIVLVEGQVVIRGTDASSQNFITPLLGQSGSDWNDTIRKATEWEVYTEGSVRQTIPFSAEIKVHPTSDGEFGKVKVGMWAYNTAGTVTLYRYRCKATFLPSNKGERLTIFDASGKAGTGIGAMTKKYPTI